MSKYPAWPWQFCESYHSIGNIFLEKVFPAEDFAKIPFVGSSIILIGATDLGGLAA
jgi:hypothetical protein